MRYSHTIMQYKRFADPAPAESLLAISMQASRRQAGSKVKHLPTGNLVDGLAAAVVSYVSAQKLGEPRIPFF
jgi:hypothetical protein